MKNIAWKDLIRETKISFTRFISIFAIIFAGVAFFSGIKSTAPAMKHSVDLYYDKYNMTDISVYSTLGLTKDDITEIQNTYGVSKVQPGYFCDVLATVEATQYVYKIHSIPQIIADNPSSEFINRPRLTEGRYPENSGECIIEDSIFYNHSLKIGDEIKVSSGTDEKITDNTLITDTFTIVGKAVSPYYLSFEKGASDIGSGKVNFFMMISEDNFILPCYTEALITVSDAISLNSYDDEYLNLVEKTLSPLENLGVERTQVRIDDIKDEAYAALDEAKSTYAEEKENYDNQINEAESNLNDAQLKLIEGQATLDANKENFDTYYSEASKQINEAQKMLDDAEEDYAESEKAYNEFIEEYGDDIDSLNETTAQLNDSREQAQESLGQINTQLQNAELSQNERKALEELAVYYEDIIATLDEQLATLNALNDMSQQQVTNLENQLTSARDELDSQASELQTARANLQNNKTKSKEEFKKAQEEIDSGWVEYDEGMTELEAQKKEGQIKLDDALQQIDDAEKEIEKLQKPQWYVLNREQLYSFVDFGKTADRMDAIAKIFPAFFFIVASLVCLTTMTRMVDEQRGCIGIYKALGYSNAKIARKYVVYAATASFLGGVSGIFAGISIFPKVIYNAWSMKYTLPEFAQNPQIILMLVSVAVGVLVTTLSALYSCNTSLKEMPSILMRPKSPKSGKKIFLEKINPLWSKFSFSQKVTARNLFRYKKRFLMTVIGILGCCSLLLAGFGLSDSISQVITKQYKEIFTYDMNIRYSESTDADEKLEVTAILEKNESVASYLRVSNTNIDIKGKDGVITASLIVPNETNAFKDYITLRNPNNARAISLDTSGMVVTQKLAKELKAGIGDFVEVAVDDEKTKKVLITAIAENYIFHYAYMSPSYYKEIFLDNANTNSLMIKLNENDSNADSTLGSNLISNDAVSSIEYYSEAISTFSDTVKILNSIVIVIIISAGILAFVVVYNLTNINICERIREIATLKVLGFYSKEVGAYVYRENIIIGALGATVGLFCGTILHMFIMVSLEQDGIMFGDYIEPISFVYAFIITIGFVVLVNILMYRRIINIPMVESLKSVE